MAKPNQYRQSAEPKPDVVTEAKPSPTAIEPEDPKEEPADDVASDPNQPADGGGQGESQEVTPASPSDGETPASTAAVDPAAPAEPEGPPMTTEQADPAPNDAPPPSVEVSVDVNLDDPKVQDAAVEGLKAQLKEAPPAIRQAAMRAVAELASEEQQAVAEDATPAVRILKPFQVRYAGQRFNMIEGYKVNDPGLAAHLLEGSYPVEAIRKGGEA